MTRLVALTGATGFIGNALTALLLQRGVVVRALVRSDAAAARLQSMGAEVVRGDIFSATALAELVQDCDAVIHAAGVVRGNNQESFSRTNCEGTRGLIDAVSSHAAGARFLLVSSLAAREPQLSWYAHSKREAEHLLQESSLDWCILRPPAVYGPGDKEMRAIFDWMSRGIAPVPGSDAARTSLIHVDDLVRGMLACISSAGATGLILYLDDGKTGGYDWEEMATIAGNVFHRQVRLWHPPAALLDTVAAINLRLGRLLGRPAMLTPPKLRELRHENWVVDNMEIRDATGWEPRIGLHEGLSKLD